MPPVETTFVVARAQSSRKLPWLYPTTPVNITELLLALFFVLYYMQYQSLSRRLEPMPQSYAGRWPDYVYIVPQIYTKAKVRLIGLGTYAPTGIITNEFFAYISTRLGDPRSAEDLERVTGMSTRHVRASTLELCRKMAGAGTTPLLSHTQAPRVAKMVVLV